MIPDPKIGCHRTGFAKKCRKLVSSGACVRYIQIQGTNPNTGDPINRWDCVDNWGPLLMIENSQMQKQTAAAIESFRNEVVKANEETLDRLSQNQRPLLLNGKRDV